MKTLIADRVAGAILIALGGVAITEAMRLYPMRMRPLVGDDTFIGLLGGGLLIFGVLFLFVLKPRENSRMEFPVGELRKKMLSVIGLVFAYFVLLPIVGYPVGTFIIAIGLFRAMGSYGWSRCTLFAGLIAGVFYWIFVLWLNTPFPQPIIGIF